MAEDKSHEKLTLTIMLPESLAKRLSLAANRTGRTLADMALDVLDRNLPKLDQGVKRAPYT
jgi:hypothetical protein